MQQYLTYTEGIVYLGETDGLQFLTCIRGIMNDKFRTEHWCVWCHKTICQYDRMYSDAVCPYCGNTVAGTIVDTYKMSYRLELVEKSPWYLFWKKDKYKKTYMGKV